MKRYIITLSIGLFLGCWGCTDIEEGPDIDSGPGGPDVSIWNDLGDVCTDTSGDYDSDGIPNGEEGCLSGRDSDGDKTPDWQDLDSDGDKVPDNVEAGTKDAKGKCKNPVKPGKDGWPCDSDGDGLPDYIDKDSDGDTLQDGDEDANGDGLLGCCLKTCNKPGSTFQQKCLLTKDGCGSGQKCVSGACTPAVSFTCSEGETDPKKQDTFGDGTLDSKRGTFICRDATESNPLGRKPVLLKNDKPGDWHLALETNAKYGVLSISGASGKMRAGMVNYEKSDAEVAGFVVSLDTTSDIQTELGKMLNTLNSASLGGSGATTVLSSGTQGKSHDLYDTVTDTYLYLKLTSATDVSSVRNDVIAALLGKSTGALANLPAPFGTSSTEMIIRFTTVKRFEFKMTGGKLDLDSKGFPQDSGDSSKWRLVVMGAVASDANYKDIKRRTRYLVDDLSNGTALALATDTVGNECDVNILTNKPVADMLWVSDESGSMNDNRKDVQANANEFFKRALSMGLDFRMGITNVVPKGKTGYAKFCSRISTSKSDSGGVDRFLLPSEQAIFSHCIDNPPGYTGGHSPGEYGLINARDALKGHLPRASSDPGKFRTNASIIIIVLTDQIAAAIESVVNLSTGKLCTLPAATQAQVNTLLQPYINLFNGTIDPEAAVAKFMVLGGVCNNKCGAWIAYGYKELVNIFGGQIADVCQKSLGPTMQAFLDSIVAGATPTVLDFVPISSSLAVTVDGTVLQRSQASGFDYNSSKNSLFFINTKYDKGSRIFASYKRWERQTVLK